MNNKNNILESWIMVEHLSEGDINLKDRTLIKLNELEDENYYDLFLNEIKKKNLKSNQKNNQKNNHKGGIVLYFDVFKFEEIITFLRNKYNLPPTEQEITYGDKFSFALYFDEKLKFSSEMTFLTESYYIRQYGKIPNEYEFSEFNEDKKKSFEEIFESQEEDKYKEHFNKAVKSILKKYNIEIQNCRMKVLINLETDATNLHSFFVKDLEKAKKVNSDILNSYILGNIGNRVNLDSRTNADVFFDILQPKNYPIARFPSNPDYSLSLMQQVAVNLATGFDNQKIRSVNGPPGTGKTTLLKDIFAELIVDQAYEIVSLSEKFIKGTNETRYWNNASIGVIPEEIADKGIVVASSNNSAVQNIVNELPLASGIDEAFVQDLVNADYFRNIANSSISTKWVEDENGRHEKLVCEESADPNKFWGLFSLEGGKKENMEYIITALKHITKYLDTEYIPNESIYQTFEEEYYKINNYKQQIQIVSEAIHQIELLTVELNNKRREYDDEENLKRKRLLEKSLSLNEFSNKNKDRIFNLELTKKNLCQQLLELENEKNNINQCIEILKGQKPGFFSLRKRKNEYREKNVIYLNQFQKIINDEYIIKSQIFEVDEKIKELESEINQKEIDIRENQYLFDKWIRERKTEISVLNDEIEIRKRKIVDIDINKLDFTVDYEKLQLSNPWFDIEYRRMQSKLFILALQVRKQFLYDNIKNIKAAYIIWNKQKDHLDNKRIIQESWNWINIVIPVISSTFASISRMCANLNENSIGHLFVDEAGQALPQASVGAIFRSKNVMVVGDPSQIKPVWSLDSSVLNMLGKHYRVSQKYLSEEASTQTLVDTISKYGFYKNKNNEEWIGIPLWVHRRCRCPMFDISNKISYGGNMVQATKIMGHSKWFDIDGDATDKYVKNQGVFLREKLQKMIDLNPDIIDENKKDIIYIISPFKNVAFQLSQELNKINFTRYEKGKTNEKGKPTNVGTVHTFQGKEAPIVFLVLGADKKSKGAANWAMGTENPNIMNVAATRAKEEFYIIGSKDLYLNLNSEVINNTMEIIYKAQQAEPKERFNAEFENQIQLPFSDQQEEERVDAEFEEECEDTSLFEMYAEDNLNSKKS